jgi:hypothetical protein
VLLATLVGVVWGADDWDSVEEVATGALDWLRGFLPFANGTPTGQTMRKVFRLLDTQALQRGFAAWAAALRAAAREVIAVDGKTLRGSGKGARRVVSTYATEAGLVLAQRSVQGSPTRSRRSRNSWTCSMLSAGANIPVPLPELGASTRS